MRSVLDIFKLVQDFSHDVSRRWGEASAQLCLSMRGGALYSELCPPLHRPREQTHFCENITFSYSSDTW